MYTVSHPEDIESAAAIGEWKKLGNFGKPKFRSFLLESMQPHYYHFIKPVLHNKIYYRIKWSKMTLIYDGEGNRFMIGVKFWYVENSASTDYLKNVCLQVGK